MKRLIPLSLLIFVTAAAVFYSATHNLGVFKKTWKQTDLGIPTADIYNTKQLISRNPWDMTLYNGKLYVGNGDYDANTGPATVIYYDLEASEWKNEGKINDEAVQRFVTLNSELIILGIDPKDSQDFGSYYRQDNSGKWQSVRTVPYGVHMFDLVSFENSLYYAIGTAKYNQSPVQKTLDGKSFENVPFYDGEKALLSDENSGFSRCYGLFEVENKLYTFCRWSKAKTFGFFEYDGNAFRLLTKIDNKNFTDININQQSLINEKVAFNGNCYISFGSLYRTKDFKNFERIAVPDNAIVQDIVVSDQKMYVLTSLKSDTALNETYLNTVWEYTEKDGLKKVLSFNYKMSAMSFCKWKNSFLVGIGDVNKSTADDNALNGKILKFE